MTGMDDKFINSMKQLLGDEIHAFTEALMRPPVRALRVNTLKISAENFSGLCPMRLEKNPFSDDGFIYDAEVFLAGLSPFHHAGLYYIQDPSSFVAIEYLRPYIGRRVLDLCAAPGGKASFAAALLKGEGFIVANEIEHTRAKTLSQNIERLGVRNALVTANSPEFFEKQYPEFFDTIIVDAPCSGEGMIRKTEQALYAWSEKGIGACFVRQSQILHSAAAALEAGGHLLYTTSTLNVTENEEVIKRFLATHDFEIVPVPPLLKSRVRTGFGLEAARVFPHDGGEGHFSCVMRKLSGEGDNPAREILTYPEPDKQTADAAAEALDGVSAEDYGLLRQKDNELVAYTDGLPIVAGLNVLRAGLKVASVMPDGTVPAHALAMSLDILNAKKNLDYSFCSAEIRDYLAGGVIHAEPPFLGYGTISLNGYCTGLVKAGGGTLKNCYPKGLRFFTS